MTGQMPASEATARLLNMIASRQVWRDWGSDSWTVNQVDGATEVNVTDFVDVLDRIGLCTVDLAGLPIQRGPWRGCRWLKLTRLGREWVADAVRRQEDDEDGGDGAVLPWQHLAVLIEAATVVDAAGETP